jgi:NAD(P)-dependent dehydrogenase (short-subunit alcohol dehydrogenase family)
MAEDYGTMEWPDERIDTPEFVKTIHKKIYSAIDPANPANPALSMAGKTILITGGATGIGYAIARNFASAGASTLILLARRASTLDEASASISKEYPRTQVLTYPTDISISNADSVTATLEAAAKASNTRGIDILVLSAVYTFTGGDVLQHASADIHGSFNVNVLGNLHLVKTFLALPSTPTHTKTIINVSSNAAYGDYPRSGVYGATKIALVTMLRRIQRERPDIKVYSFHPGLVETAAMKQFTEIDTEQIKDYMDDVSLPGGFAVWLASPAAEFLKGRYLQSKWDVEDLVANKDKFEKDPNLAVVYLKL